MLLKQYKELKYRISQNLPSEKYSTISSDASFFFSFPSSFGEEKIKAKHTWATQQEERMNENLTVLPLCKENIRSQHREKQRLRPLNSCDKSKACTLKLPFVENTVRHNKTEMLGKCKLCL